MKAGFHGIVVAVKALPQTPSADAGHLAVMPSLHAHGLHPLGLPDPLFAGASCWRFSRLYAFFKNAR